MASRKGWSGGEMVRAKAAKNAKERHASREGREAKKTGGYLDRDEGF